MSARDGKRDCPRAHLPRAWGRLDPLCGARIAAALAVPWQTAYTAPLAMALSGVAYALHGYEVRWSEPRVERDDAGLLRVPASLSYACFRVVAGERAITHGVEVRCQLPEAFVRAEMRAWRLLKEVTRGA